MQNVSADLMGLLNLTVVSLIQQGDREGNSKVGWGGLSELLARLPEERSPRRKPEEVAEEAKRHLKAQSSMTKLAESAWELGIDKLGK